LNTPRHISTFTIDWYLPGTNSGGPVRSIANLVSALPEIDFYIITRNTDYCSTEPYEGIPANTWVQQEANVWVYYFSEDQLTKKKLKEVMNGVQASSVYVSGIYSLAFSQWPVSIAKSLGSKTIIAARGMLSPHALAVKPMKKYLFLSFMRWINAYVGVEFHATSENEVEDIKRILGKQTKVHLLSNIAKPQEESKLAFHKEEGSLKLVYIGRIAPEKGTLHALHALQEQKGNIAFHLYGTCYDASYWQECQEVINSLSNNLQVYYHGACTSEEVAQHIQSTHALFLPSEGENYGHAIVESLSLGRPVIISKNTPWKELAEQKAGMDVEVPELKAAIEKFVQMNQEEYTEWTMSTLDYYERKIGSQIQKTIEGYTQMFTAHA
jgi:glycosyltransferase involved in cell wall biosynthesis